MKKKRLRLNGRSTEAAVVGEARPEEKKISAGQHRKTRQAFHTHPSIHKIKSPVLYPET